MTTGVNLWHASRFPPAALDEIAADDSVKIQAFYDQTESKIPYDLIRKKTAELKLSAFDLSHDIISQNDHFAKDCA